jgi:hypothetical protein
MAHGVPLQPARPDAHTAPAGRLRGVTPDVDGDADMKQWFGPRSYRGGRIQVFGCSPGCLLISLLGSLVLTVALNLLLRAL